MQQSFDLSPLRQRITLRQFWRQLKSYAYEWKLGMVILSLLFVPVLIGLPIMAYGLLTALFPVDGGVLAFLLFLAAIGVIGIVSIYRQINETTQAQRFAEANNLQFLRDGIASEYYGTPFRAAAYVPYAMRTTSQHFIELGYWRPSVRDQVTHTYFRLKLPHTLPTMVLQRSNGRTLLPGVPTNGEQLTLEGEFGNLFTLFTAKDGEQAALYIFTPDVMERFIDVTRDFDCEVVGDEMYFYTHRKITLASVDNMAKIEILLRHVLEKFHQQSGKFTAANTAPSATSLPVSSSKKAGVQPTNVTLKSSLRQNLTVGGIIGVFVLGIGGFFAYHQAQDIQQKQQLIEKGVTTEATITERYQRGGRSGVAYNIHYRFTVMNDGKTKPQYHYHYGLSRADWNKTNVGDTMTVRYLPAHPEINVAEKHLRHLTPTTTQNLGFIIGMTGIVATSGLLLVVIRKVLAAVARRRTLHRSVYLVTWVVFFTATLMSAIIVAATFMEPIGQAVTAPFEAWFLS